MTKEKMARQLKYLNLLMNRLSSPTPEKHKDHPESFKQFLNREIATVKAGLDRAKLQDLK